MKIVPCGHVGTSTVIDSRKMGGTVYRVRKCGECGHQLATVEVPTATGRMPVGLQAGRKKAMVRIASWKDIGWTRLVKG